MRGRTRGKPGGCLDALRTVSVEKRCDYRHREDLKEVIEEKEKPKDA